MTQSILITLAVTGFTIAFLHAAIPTHWLPFVLTGRVQKWSRAKTLVVTAVAGSGHVLFTAVLGFLVAWAGIAVSDRIGAWFPRIAGGTLILFGLFYVYRQLSGHGHGHVHLFGGHHHHDHEHSHGPNGTGPNGGPVIDTGHGYIEVSVFESGVPPRFRLHFADPKTGPLVPAAPHTVAVSTVRPTGERQTFTLRRGPGFLESVEEIPEPHEFTVRVELRHGDHAHRHEVQFSENGHDHDSGHSHHHDGPGHHHNGHVPQHDGHHHGHPGGHVHAHEPAAPAPKSDWTAIVGLFALLTFSPCEGFIPVYITGVRYGWGGFALLTAILSIGTVLGMVVFTWLTLIGLEKLKLKWFERYESGVLGGLLCLLGVIVMIFEH
jgi:ABC-type nickel/cobalt efflux system permease component RcnA